MIQGIGDKQDAKFFGHYYLNGDDTLDKSLAAKGFSRADITDVFLTHLHFDHCGGAIAVQGDKLVPAFPNAIYWSNESHWNWAVNPNDREKAFFKRKYFAYTGEWSVKVYWSSSFRDKWSGTLIQRIIYK